jgi:fluoroacetyl-CoA thioesterase
VKPSLQPGLRHQFRYTVPDNKTVPHLYPESESFQQMPQVLATGFMVGLMEWACIEAIKPHLDWPHLAATPPGLTITVDVTLDKIDGRRLFFSVVAHDGVDRITEGSHERVVIDRDLFASRIAGKTPRT